MGRQPPPAGTGAGLLGMARRVVALADPRHRREEGDGSVPGPPPDYPLREPSRPPPPEWAGGDRPPPAFTTSPALPARTPPATWDGWLPAVLVGIAVIFGPVAVAKLADAVTGSPAAAPNPAAYTPVERVQFVHACGIGEVAGFRACACAFDAIALAVPHDRFVAAPAPSTPRYRQFFAACGA